MNDPEMDMLACEARRERGLPRDARCERCRDTRHLSTSASRILCYACLRAEGGAGPSEADHPAGRRNVAAWTVRLAANDHRTVTELRTRIGLDEWPEADGDPLLAIAHFLAGTGTLLILVAEWLVLAAQHIAATMGPDIWRAMRAAPVLP